jgi:NADH-quinone oxidoreductase subunit J
MQTTTDYALVAALVLSAMLTMMSSRLLRSVIGLAVTSAVLAAIMFRLGGPIAAVIELSVCAGLIPAIFISAVSMTARLSMEEATARWREKLRTVWILPVLLLVTTGVLLTVSVATGYAAPLPGSPDVRTVIWTTRQLDMLGQVTVMLAGAFAVVALVKEAKEVRS